MTEFKRGKKDGQIARLTDEDMKRIEIQSQKVINYQRFIDTSMCQIPDSPYKLSIVSGRTDVPAFINAGLFEVAIVYKNRWRNDLNMPFPATRVIDYALDFDGVADIIKKFKKSPEKLWKKADDGY